MNIAKVAHLFGTNMQVQNEFHLQLSSLLARNLHWTKAVNGKIMATTLTQMNSDCN